MGPVNRRSFMNRSGLMLGLTGLSASAGATAKTLTKLKNSLRYGPAPGIAKLNANENPFGPSPKAIKAMQLASEQGAYYVGESVPRLKAMIAERHGLTPEHVSLSSGSSGVLTYLAVAKGREGHILGPDLFWDTTAKAGVRQAGEIKRLPKEADLGINLAKLGSAISKETALVHITNPNNPTGLLLDGKTLANFCREASKKTTILVDEAYNEVTDNPEINSMVPLIKEGHDLLVARTFSKIYGLAGMRVGYMLSSPENAQLINRFGLGDYAMNQAGVAAAIASYDDTTFLAKSKANIIEGREAITDAAKSLGLQAMPSETNFVFINLGDMNAELFRQRMAGENVLIRGIYRDYTQWSRVSMGHMKDVNQYIAALPKVLDALAVAKV